MHLKFGYFLFGFQTPHMSENQTHKTSNFQQVPIADSYCAAMYFLFFLGGGHYLLNLVPNFNRVVGMRFHQGLGRVQAEVDVASRSQVPDQNDGTLKAEIQQLGRKGLLKKGKLNVITVGYGLILWASTFLIQSPISKFSENLIPDQFFFISKGPINNSQISEHFGQFSLLRQLTDMPPLGSHTKTIKMFFMCTTLMWSLLFY